MKERIFTILNKSNGRVWMICLDLVLVIASVFVAYLLRYNLRIPDSQLRLLPGLVPGVVIIRFIFFFLFRIQSGLLRFIGLTDFKKIALSVLGGTISFYALNKIYMLIYDRHLFPESTLYIDFFFLITTMTTYRALIKIVLTENKPLSSSTKQVIILGSGDQAMITKRTLDQDLNTVYDILGFIDEDSQMKGRYLEGIKILQSREDLDAILTKQKVDILLVCKSKLTIQQKETVIEKCLSHGMRILNVPDPDKWINGSLSINQFKEYKIEDLLQREPIQLDISNIKAQLRGSKILVTGGAGSIGSEMVRQIMSFDPEKVLILDQAESPLYEVELEIAEKFGKNTFSVALADIRNETRLRNIFESFKPDFVYHAAAYKHVPMMENNPLEAITTNVLGTLHLANLSLEYNVKKFVMVSTDKAVNPTNIMGASKRIAEMYVQALNEKLRREESSYTRFITTRFGNVLGSNGSVIQLFRKQIQNGGPITITDPEVTRFFMTIPEACQLVLEAGMIGKGGEIFLFDMGKSVKILDLAKNMVKLAGLELGKDINLSITGLRPGEKLYEELLNDKENSMPTHHNKIMIAKVQEINFGQIELAIQNMLDQVKQQDIWGLVRTMKSVVPEFKSNNSPFADLDHA